MNIPSQVTNGATNQLVISAARACLIYATIQNTSGATRLYVLADASSAPPTSTVGPTGLRSPPISAGQTWNPTIIGSSQAIAFNYGIVLQSFAVDAIGNPIFTALSAADASVTAWSSALQ